MYSDVVATNLGKGISKLAFGVLERLSCDSVFYYHEQRDTWNQQTTDTENTSPDRFSLQTHSVGELLVQASPEDT